MLAQALKLQLRKAIASEFAQLEPRADIFCAWVDLFLSWNERLNLVSRKDTENLITRHVLPNLAFLKVGTWPGRLKVLDVGTGGGFPGLILAIARPDITFTLVDSIAKKIKAVDDMAQTLGLSNVYVESVRVETLPWRGQIAVGRAVSTLAQVLCWIHGKILLHSDKSVPSGLLYLKGGPLEPNVNPQGLWPLHELVPSLPDEDKYIVRALPGAFSSRS